MNTILEYAQRNKSSFEMGGVSSNEDASVFEFVEGTAWDNDFFPKEIYFLRMPEDILKIVLASIGVGMMMQINRSGVVTSR